MSCTLLLSCEHAGNHVPAEYRSLFAQANDVLLSHRGWDPGAWHIAQFLATQLQTPLFGCLTTRLLIEPNRSIDNPQLFSDFTNSLSEDLKELLMRQFYFPYRDAIEKTIHDTSQPIVHLSIHSFTPVWHNETRTTDIGLLFDPLRKMETSICEQLRLELQKQLPEHVIDFNEPYKGTDDGFTTYLRKFHPDNQYAGIEIEINQKFAPHPEGIQRALLKAIQSSLY
jgi:predicted N-formylglutamate amidohydrolase